MKRLIVFVALLCLVSSSCVASLVHYTMTVKDGASTTLEIGEQRTIQIWALADGASSGDGIVEWFVDLHPDSYGVVTAVSYDIFEPSQQESGLDPALNEDDGFGGEGSFQFLGAAFPWSQTPPATDAGVGQYSLLGEVVIEGVAVGNVNYEIGNEYLAGFYARLKSGTSLDGVFGTAEKDLSDYQFTVVLPEPSTIAILSGLSAIALRKRKRR